MLALNYLSLRRKREKNEKQQESTKYFSKKMLLNQLEDLLLDYLKNNKDNT